MLHDGPMSQPPIPPRPHRTCPFLPPGAPGALRLRGEKPHGVASRPRRASRFRPPGQSCSSASAPPPGRGPAGHMAGPPREGQAPRPRGGLPAVGTAGSPPCGSWLCPREPGRDAQTVGVDSRKARSWLEPRPVLYGILLNNKKNIVDAAMSPGSWPRAAPAEAAICRQPRRKLRAGQHQAAAGTACAASRRSPVCGGGTCLGVCVGASPRPPEAAAASTQQDCPENQAR